MQARPIALAALLTLGIAAAARAQDPIPADTSAASADSLEARLLGELGEAGEAAPAAAAPRGGGSLNPDLSVIADLVVDLSPDEATLEGGDRLQLREIEIGLQGAVDPYFRYDAFLGLHGDGIEVEEAYATTLALPRGLQARLGRFLLPMGKVNLAHLPEQNAFDLPFAHRAFFGEEGFSSTGLWGSWLGGPLGFPLELSLVLANGSEAHGHGAEEEEHALAAAVDEDEEHGEGRDLLDDLGDRLWVAHGKGSFDPSEAANLEVGASWATEVAEEEPALEGAEPLRARTTHYGVDVTWCWKPPARGKYRSAMLQAEAIWRDAEGAELGTRFGAFGFGQVQLGRRWFAGARLDRVELPDEDAVESGGQLLLRYFPTEFSQLRLVYERRDRDDADPLDRLLFQTTFALGPHRPHAF